MNSHDILTQVNIDINQIEYGADLYGDDWVPAVPGSAADCDSYATAKFQALADRGWPLSQLRLATCWVEASAGSGYHAVLLVDLDGQTWVLDNRYTFPTEYQLFDYRWGLLQIAGTQKFERAIN